MPFEIIDLIFKLNEIDVFRSINAILALKNCENFVFFNRFLKIS